MGTSTSAPEPPTTTVKVVGATSSIVIVGAAILIGAGLQDTAGIVAPLFFVITLVITVAPLRAWLIRRGWPSVLASTATMVVIYLLILLILGSVVYAVVRLVDKLPDYAAAFQQILDSVADLAAQLGLGQQQLETLQSSFDLNSLAEPAQALLSSVSDGASMAALIAALVFFLAFETDRFGDRMSAIRRTHHSISDGLSEFALRVRKYWTVTTIFGLIAAVLSAVALAIIGVPLYVTWGVLAFVTNYIPNVGFIIGVIPPALIALLEGGPGSAVAVLVAYTLINVVVQTLIQPQVTGDAVGISAVVAFISLIFWTYLLGALGALLAVPATLFVKTMLIDPSPRARWVGALISSEPADTPSPRRPAPAEA